MLTSETVTEHRVIKEFVFRSWDEMGKFLFSDIDATIPKGFTFQNIHPHVNCDVHQADTCEEYCGVRGVTELSCTVYYKAKKKYY
jgi:hypothetical protein